MNCRGRLTRCATILAAVSGVLSLPFESQSVLHAKTNCPAVSPLADLNQTEYLRASWFIQRQQLTGYQQVAIVTTPSLFNSSVCVLNDPAAAEGPFLRGHDLHC